MGKGQPLTLISQTVASASSGNPIRYRTGGYVIVMDTEAEKLRSEKEAHPSNTGH